MSKALCYAGLVISGLILLVFGMDLTTLFLMPESAFPFGGASMMMDLGFVLASIVLGYLSWVTLREQE